MTDKNTMDGEILSLLLIGTYIGQLSDHIFIYYAVKYLIKEKIFFP